MSKVLYDKARLRELFVFLSEGEGGVIEGKSGRYLTLRFNYETSYNTSFAISPIYMHNIQIVKRLLSGELKLAQTPKKLYPAKYYEGMIKIIGKPFKWKGVAN